MRDEAKPKDNATPPSRSAKRCAPGLAMSPRPALRVILLRAGLFMFFANSIWALLPLVAHKQLHLGSDGYGLPLGGVGIGAAGGAGALPRLRGHVTAGPLMTSGTLLFAGVTLAPTYARVSALAAAVLIAPR